MKDKYRKWLAVLVGVAVVFVLAYLSVLIGNWFNDLTLALSIPTVIALSIIIPSISNRSLQSKVKDFLLWAVLTIILIYSVTQLSMTITSAHPDDQARLILEHYHLKIALNLAVFFQLAVIFGKLINRK